MPTGSAMEPFKAELAGYKTGKDAIQLPYDKPLPEELIRMIAAYRAKQVRENDVRRMYRLVIGRQEYPLQDGI